MGVARLDGVGKQFGGATVLEDVTVEFHDGEIVGLVGPNGAGKTTLFRLILGRFEPDHGAVTRSKGLEVGYLPQEPELRSDSTLHDEVAAAFADLLDIEHRMHALSDEIARARDAAKQKELMAAYDRLDAEFIAAGGYTMEQRLGEILGGLGFVESDWKLPVAALSGGQKCRAALARLLLQDNSLLLLDEPTNHLDIDACRWLEQFLKNHHGGAVIISHDRYLLDRVADRIVELENTRVAAFPGNYSNYMQTRELRRLTQERQFEKDRAFIDKEKAYIAKYLAGQRSSQAKGRRTRLARRLDAGEFTLERPGERETVKLKFDADVPTGRVVLRGEGLSKRYGDKVLFADLSLQISAGQRIGITGPNGTGKSTLIKCLLDEIRPDAGTVQRDAKTTIGYYAQDARDLDPQRTILQEIQVVRPDYSELAARSLLGRFLFRGDDVFKSVALLSGGEQSRVRLLKLILAAPAMLVLDEPTNHLDIPSREALEEALSEYPGTILTVSHDRYFLDQIVDKLLLMRPGGCRLFNGNYTQAMEALDEEEARARAARLRAEAAARQRPRPAGRGAAGKATPPARKSPFEKLTTEELETGIMEREAKIAELVERFGDPAVARDRAKLAELDAQLTALRAELAEIEGVWGRRIAEA